MKIQILGTGCRKCSELFANAEKAVKTTAAACELEKVSDMEEIVKTGVMTTPALVIDGKVVSSGKLLSSEEIAKIIEQESVSCSCCSCGCEDEKEAEAASGSCCSCGCEDEKEAEAAPCCCCEKKSGGFFKKVFTVLLLLFAAGSVLYILDRENKSAESNVTEKLPADVLKVYYFHGTKRCMTCSKIEELTRNAVGKAEKVKFIPVNVEEPRNEHFIKGFQLVSRTVVMERNGKFEKFDRVWELVGTPEKLTAYIKEGVERLSK